MRIFPVAALLALVGCTELPVCPLIDEHHIGPDDAGPDGFSANDVLALVGSGRTFSVGPNPDYLGFPTGVDDGVTVTIGQRRGRPFVREWTCTPPTMAVTVDVRVVSDDGTLDVESVMEVGGTALTEGDVWWHVSSEAPLGGIVPDALTEAAVVEQESHCPEDADEEPTVRVFLSGALDASSLHFDAQYRRRGVCSYAATLASALLVSR